MFGDLIDSPTKALAPQAGPNLTPLPDPGPIKPEDTDKAIRMLGGDVGQGALKAAKENRVLDAEQMKFLQPPPAPQLKPPPKMEETNPMEAWGSMSMIFSLLAASRVRYHATAAMNAMTGAFQGLKQRDKDMFDAKYKEWEAENKNMLDLAEFQQRAYKQVLDRVEHAEQLNTDVGKAEDEAAKSRVKALAVALQDPIALAALEKGGLPALIQLQRTREENQQRLELYKIQVSAAGQKAQNAMLAQSVKQMPEYQALTTLDQKIMFLSDHGVAADPMIMEMLKSEDKRAGDAVKSSIAGAKLKFDYDKRDGDIKQREKQLEEKKREFDLTADDKEKRDAFYHQYLKDRTALAEERIKLDTEVREGLLELSKEKFTETVKKDEAVIAQRATNESDKMTLARAGLTEKTAYDNMRAALAAKKEDANEDIATAKLTLAARNLARLTTNDEVKAKFTERKMNESLDEFRERMRLATANFFEKVSVDERKAAQVDAREADLQGERQLKHEDYQLGVDIKLKENEQRAQVQEDRNQILRDRVKLAEKQYDSKLMDPEETEFMAREMVKLHIPMASDSLAARNPSWREANRKALEIAKAEGKPDFSEQWYRTLDAQRRSAVIGPTSQKLRSLDVANLHLQSLEAAVMGLPDASNVRAVSRTFNFFANQVNDSKLADVDVTGTVVAEEIVKALAGSGSLSSEERLKIASMFDPSRGKESLLSIIHQFRELLGGQNAGFLSQFSHYGNPMEITGMSPETAESFFIDPKTGRVSAELAERDRARNKALLKGQPAPKPDPRAGAAPGGAPAGGIENQKPRPDGYLGGTKNGREVVGNGTEWFYADTGQPVEP